MLLSHIRVVQSSEPGFRIQCNFQGCRRSFKNFSTFRNHIYGYHKEATQTDKAETRNEVNLDFERDNAEDNECEQAPPIGITTNELERSAALWILKTKECHRIPQSVLDGMLPDLISLFQEASTLAQYNIKETLMNAGVSSEIVRSAFDHMTEDSILSNPFRSLNSHCRQLNYFRQNFGLQVKIFL